VSASPQRIGIIGAGIIGLATARRFRQLLPDAEIVVLEKEDGLAQHQTGHNSGVVHAGLYYAPGSLKAKLCRTGGSMLREFCLEKSLPYDECGKVVVALNESEIPALREIERRAQVNGVPNLRWLDGSGLREIEPHAAGIAAVLSPHTAITDFPGICQALANEITTTEGSEVQFGVEVTQVIQTASSVIVTARNHDPLAFDTVVLCAGLHSDTLARAAGDDEGPAIVPFRGEYLKLVPERTDLVNGLIYPVPDPAYPFLGVHFTKRVDGSVDVGPNAVLAFAKEGYKLGDVSLAEIGDMLRWPGFWQMARKHWRMGPGEMLGSASKRVFVHRARKYVPDISIKDVVAAPAGVRAQAVDRDGALVDDFRISRLGRVTAVRNAPSPAATAALAIAEMICDQALDRGSVSLES
jgi:L-2-hydroxyglutarate oxidase LhgO